MLSNAGCILQVLLAVITKLSCVRQSFRATTKHAQATTTDVTATVQVMTACHSNTRLDCFAEKKLGINQSFWVKLEKDNTHSVITVGNAVLWSGDRVSAKYDITVKSNRSHYSISLTINKLDDHDAASYACKTPAAGRRFLVLALYRVRVQPLLELSRRSVADITQWRRSYRVGLTCHLHCGTVEHDNDYRLTLFQWYRNSELIFATWTPTWTTASGLNVPGDMAQSNAVRKKHADVYYCRLDNAGLVSNTVEVSEGIQSKQSYQPVFWLYCAPVVVSILCCFLVLN